MKIFIEGFHYDPLRLGDSLKGMEDYFVQVSDGRKTDHIGYFYNKETSEAVFFLPKVFVGEDAKAFGLDPHDIIKVDADDSPLKKNGEDSKLYEMSVWIYRAIKKYNDDNDNIIVKEGGAADIISEDEDSPATWLDLVLSLISFSKKHKALFTRIATINHSGNNNIHWGKTINQVRPYLQDGDPYYLELRNKKKVINFDEDLIVLFYSVLDYLKDEWHFNVETDLRYNLLSHEQIRQMIDTGSATSHLRSIRRRYYTDELVSLWKLLFAFFDKAEAVDSNRGNDEALLVTDFDRVFEKMVDEMIGDATIEQVPEFRELKHQKGGRQLDHLFRYKSLLDDTELFYIGDSKYYSEASSLEAPSIDKQYEYAANVTRIAIQHQLKGEWMDLMIRDVEPARGKTEGYNPIPNFFIRGHVDLNDISYEDPQLQKTDKDADMQLEHFRDRLFDRDTLLLRSYNINFLYLVAAYVENSSDCHIKESIWSAFRSDLRIKLFSNYDIFKVYPADSSPVGIKQFIKENFFEYHGNMYHVDGDDFIWFAFQYTGGAHKSVSDIERMLPLTTVKDESLLIRQQ